MASLSDGPRPGLRKLSARILLRSSGVALSVFGVFLFTGCQSGIAPTKPVYISKYADTAFNYGNKQASNYFRSAYEAKEDRDERRIIRDKICYDLINQIDYHYNNFEARITGLKGAKDFGGDMALLGLNAAGAITGTAEIKSILAAISGGIVGVNASADKAFLKEKTVEVVQLQMQASRNRQLAVIINNLKGKDDDQYPLEFMLKDVTEYYYSGTIPRAFQALAEKVGEAGAEATQELFDAKTK